MDANQICAPATHIMMICQVIDFKPLRLKLLGLAIIIEPGRACHTF